MWNFIIPSALKAVGINAGINLLRNKPLLQNAGTAAITGGTFGGYNNYMDTGNVLGASSAGQQVANAAMSANALAAAPQAAGNWAMVDGTLTNMDYYKNILGTPVFTGGQGLLSNAMDMASNQIPSFLKDNMTPQNLLGAGMLLNQNNAPMMPAPQGARTGGSQVPYTPMINVQVPERPRRLLIG